MHLALPGARSGPVAALAEASPRRLLNGQHALLAVIAGVTWLALMGGVLSTYILTDGSGGASHSHYLPLYVAYDTQEVVPMSFGSLSVTRAELTPLADSVEVQISVRVNNDQDEQIDAPRFEDLRLINTLGAEAKPKPGGWSGPAVLIGHSNATIDLTYLAPPDMGLLWLEYREPTGQWPIRVALGSASTPQPTAAADPGDVQ